jgi:hypothetical protein
MAASPAPSATLTHAMRGCLLLLALPILPACIPEEPVVAPVTEEAPPPAERVVVSSVTVRSRGDGSSHHVGATRASDADRVRPDPVFFRLGAGYGAVGAIDLGPCRDKGLDPGYVHIHVTFDGAGTVAHASVESPTPPPPEALACISERLKAAAVPAFEGGDVTLSKSLFVTDGVAQEGRGPEIFVDGEPKSASGARGLTLLP